MTSSPSGLSSYGAAGTSPPHGWHWRPLAGLCDLGEAHIVARGLASAGLGQPGSPVDLERMGFFVCVVDLEDELTRYARLLTEAISLDRMPRPLAGLLSAI